MESFSPSTLKTPHISSKIQLFTQFRRTPLRNHHHYPHFLLKFPSCTHHTMQITSQFGRTPKRRNYMRKKLIEKQHKVQKLLIDNDSIDKVSIFKPTVNNIDEIEVIEDLGISDNVEKSNLFDNWVDMYEKDAEFRGVEGNVERVDVNEDRDSSIAEHVSSWKELGFVNELRSVILKPGMVSQQLPRVGFVMICSLVVFSVVKRVFKVRNDRVELTREEKRMLRRKLKSRMEEEKGVAGNVEILPKVGNAVNMSAVRPKLDKDELMNCISRVKGSGEKVKLLESSGRLDIETRKIDCKVQEIKEMARQAREVERKCKEESEDVNKDLSVDLKGSGKKMNGLGVNHRHDLSDGGSLKPGDSNSIKRPPFEDDPPVVSIGVSENVTRSLCDSDRRESSYTSQLMDTEGESQLCDNSTMVSSTVHDPPPVDIQSLVEKETLHASENTYSQSPAIFSTNVCEENGATHQLGFNCKESITLHVKDIKEKNELCKDHNDDTFDSEKSTIKMTPRIILSVKEAREYLSQKNDRGELDSRNLRLEEDIVEPSIDEDMPVKESKLLQNQKELCDSSDLDAKSARQSVMNAFGNSSQKKIHRDADTMQSIPLKSEDYYDKEAKDDSKRPIASKEYGDVHCNREATPVIPKESWMEKNFQDFEPMVKKIGDGFRENYMIAKDKVNEELNLRSEINLPGDDNELEWMKDDSLREIVFQVRENELMGCDPFHMMDAADKQAFFEGLEKKVEKENEKLSNLHELIHSRIENLDYGADGISLYDPPEKVIPRWKGPAFGKDPEFLNNADLNKSFSSQSTGVSHPANQDLDDILRNSADAPASVDGKSSLALPISSKAPQSWPSKNPKTVIESSDGVSRAGKKRGKEYWQHTKKWSREFLELYNAETDPEVKSIMKDMGKDLNKWITEKEIQETADLMTQIPEKKRRYIEKKIGKLKREMEIFGPQAVVNKYREYGEEEEDYLWWLDLRFVLCIELYTNEDGAQKVGFYSLEMAEDLELDPKQYHVIAFEDPGDSKSFCYIIQAHLEMLGKGNAVVVARPPKDAFREAKANGFSVTVIRKGELQLNVDQTLEEVEEQITEIGSKVYHDKIMRERSVDMGSLMKGVFGSSKTAKRGNLKRTPKKLSASDH